MNEVIFIEKITMGPAFLDISLIKVVPQMKRNRITSFSNQINNN